MRFVQSFIGGSRSRPYIDAVSLSMRTKDEMT